MIEHVQSYLKSHDQHRLYYEAYLPQNPKAVLVVIHGLNEHSGRYQNLIDWFSEDYALYILNLRGHGKSDGIRSHVAHFDEYVGDVKNFIDLVFEKNSHKKIFLIAHSMGGQIALNYLAQNPQAPLAGFITSSANIELGWQVNPIKKFVGMKLVKYFPRLRLPREVNHKWISHDRTVVKKYLIDPLVNKTISLSLAHQILENQEAIHKLAPQIKFPALMMHAGADRICAKEGSEKFHHQLASQDKTLKIYKGYYHELFNEIGKEEVFQDMQEWIEAHL